MHIRYVGILMISVTLSCLGMCKQEESLVLPSVVYEAGDEPSLEREEYTNVRKRAPEDCATNNVLAKRYEPAQAPQREQRLRQMYRSGLVKNNVTAVEALLEGGWPVNDCNSVHAPMTLAAKNNSPEMIELLNKYGADVRTVSCEGMTPLMSAACYGGLEAVCMLLQLAQEKKELIPMLNDKDPRKKSAFMIATIKGNVPVMKMLISYGASPLGKCDYEKMTSFLWAAFMGKLEALKCILEWAKANHTSVIKDRDSGDKNALMIGAFRGHENIVDFLVDKIDVNEKTGLLLGETALMLATYHNRQSIVKTLWQHGANIDHQRVDGQTPLMIAASKGHSVLCRLFLSWGARVDLRSRSGDTALALAANEDIENLLLSKMSAEIKDEMLLNQARRRSAHQTNDHARSKSL